MSNVPPAGPPMSPRELMTQRFAQANAQKTQQEVHYRDAATQDQSCGACANFRPPDACVLVEGQINPLGVCDLFEPANTPSDQPDQGPMQ